MQGLAAELLINAVREEKPIVLVAGQDFAVPPAPSNVLTLFKKRIGHSDERFSWRQVLDHQINDEDKEFLAERFDRMAPNSIALCAIELPWSAVFTSSIDPRFASRFSTRGRQPEAVLSRNHYARVSRSKSRPPVYHLFGRLSEVAPEARIPSSKIELALRKQTHASELLNRVADTATAHGLVIIDGVDVHGDWLEIDDLFAALLSQPGMRVLWFQAPQTLSTDLSLAMQETGALVTTEVSLGSCVATLEAEGLLDLSEVSAPEDPARITIADGAIDISPQLRLRVEASANIVDDTWTAQPPALDGDQLAEAFRVFHGDLGGFRNLVEGIERGFAIERGFERDLWRLLERAVRRADKSDGLVVLHGQSATGKSVALARLTWLIRTRLRLPVLVCLNRLPSFADIDGFCVEAEQAGAPTTVLVCDANLPIHRYRELTSALQSRGRKVTTVGTTYRIEDRYLQGQDFAVEAPVELSPEETAALGELIAQMTPGEAVVGTVPDGWNMLAWVYRKLSWGRSRVAHGIGAEARRAEALIRERARTTPRPANTSKLAEQLLQVGFAGETFSIFDEDTQGAELGEDVAGRLVDLVMVTGRLDVPVPINLLIRVLSSQVGHLDYTTVGHIFENLDLFRWRTADAEGSDLLISPRLQLEAELICRRRLAGTDREIECVVDLIRGVQFEGIEQAHERSFLIDLLQKLDRDGPRGKAYRQGYLRFAAALRYLREQRGICDASLMLRECVFYRQAIFSQDGPDSAEQMPEEERLRVLDTARSVIEEAIRLAASGEMHVGKRNRLNLSVERASIYGYLAVQRARTGDPTMWSEYEAARQAGLRATALTDDYHPIDVALWTALDVLEGERTDLHKAQLVADLYSTLDLAETINLRPEQRVRYEQRRHKVASILEDKALGEDALRSLDAVAPATAAFLRARQLAPDLSDGALASEDQVSKALHAAQILEKNLEAMRDVRCLRLLVRMRWLVATGQRLFRGERGRTPSDATTASQLLDLVATQNERLGDAVRNQDRYLEAVLAFLSGDVRGAADLFRDLARDTEFEDRSRIIRKLISTGIKGQPIDYSGRVRRHLSGDRWLVDVDGLGAQIGLLEHEFRSEQISPGRQLNRFWIAFNYIGPVAEYPR